MAMLTVRNLDDELKRRLRRRAADHGCSMEEETRQILREALEVLEDRGGLGSRVHARILELTGGVELEPRPRSAPRPAPDFAEGGR